MEQTIIALCGNPNVGKSTVFNQLTGLKQHTGNWTGKTVANAFGTTQYNGAEYLIADLPGTYSLSTCIGEEQIAVEFIIFGGAAATVVVCDATCLERNLNLVLQTLEITCNTVLCVNLIDEADKKNIKIDLDGLAGRLGIDVVGAAARSGKGLDELMQAVSVAATAKKLPLKIDYPQCVENAIDYLMPYITADTQHIDAINRRWLALKFIDGDNRLIDSIKQNFNLSFENTINAVGQLNRFLDSNESFRDIIATTVSNVSNQIYNQYVKTDTKNAFDKKLDKVLTSRLTGIPIMLACLGIIVWLTLQGANYPSQALTRLFGWVEIQAGHLFDAVGAPQWLKGAVVDGIFRCLSWVVAVMLPPMAIFFPLFTLLEDFGYLPRVAFNLDNSFKKCGACGKQALTMCMGLGCNACGVIGCRIIDSPREKLIAVITNSFVPCNGRFPTLISVIMMFFAAAGTVWAMVAASGILTVVVMFGILLTFLSSFVLSKTLLKGQPSSFTLELPPYRKPQIAKVFIRSIFDRTLFVLGRAVIVAAPMGLVIWVLANVSVSDVTLLKLLSDFLQPIGQLMGLDGMILLAFVLGFPANEIVVPILITGYMSAGSLTAIDNYAQLKQLLELNGWNWVTAVCMLIFCLCHWPCSTTCMTIKKETKSLKWTAAAAALPTAVGFVLCVAVNLLSKLFV